MSDLRDELKEALDLLRQAPREKPKRVRTVRYDMSTGEAVIVTRNAEPKESIPNELFRGVGKMKPHYKDACAGIIKPRSQTTSTNSGSIDELQFLYREMRRYEFGFTAWSESPAVARSMAGETGVIVKVGAKYILQLWKEYRVFRSIPASDSWLNEKEWFIDGEVNGEVFYDYY